MSHHEKEEGHQEGPKNGLATQVANLQEEMEVVKGSDSFTKIDVAKLCMYPIPDLSPKFKIPDFEKYNGQRCPVAHLTLYGGTLERVADGGEATGAGAVEITEWALEWPLPPNRPPILSPNFPPRAPLEGPRCPYDMKDK
ncbi:hypothetical protein HHK36_011666 [Tetracentron sinense]|uniref:Uncharacterized protein n=1 Tax=Tetracentron sinense TaxID=13715 RepID=A0A835DK32_TETSI|nr:hypothetical protein HHK36_011666 [Tetracentron sinense]